MLAIERRDKITAMLQNQKTVLVTELSKLFDVTEETIRRDLEKLEGEGVLKRTHGGAVLRENINIDLPLAVREGSNIEGKQAIAKRLAAIIEDGDSIILDSSSTALFVAKNIKDKKRLTVITNAEKVVLELSNAKDCKVISTGGTLKANSMSFIGHWAEKAIENYYVDKAILSCKGLDINRGITDSNEMEIEVKKAMINSASKAFLVVDNSKFDKVSFAKLVDFDKINVLVTDKRLPLEWEEKLESCDVKLLYCE